MKNPKPPTRSHLIPDGKNWDKQAVADIVCEAIACSSRSVPTILAAGHDGHDLPAFSTWNRWLCDESCGWLRDQYARAKEAQADYMAEEMAELHEKSWVPLLDGDGKPVKLPDGTIVRIVDKSSVLAVRLEAENKKWLMGKLRPKKYGDKIGIGQADGLDPVQSDVTDRAARVAELLAKAATKKRGG